MIETITAPNGTALTHAADVSAGPVVVGVGGKDPASVLRAARMLEAHAGGSILAATVVEPPSAIIVGPRGAAAAAELRGRAVRVRGSVAHR